MGRAGKVVIERLAQVLRERRRFFVEIGSAVVSRKIADFNGPETVIGQQCLMPDEYPLALRQADQARADFAAISDDLDFIKAQLARVPTRRDQARNTLGVIFAMAVIVILFEMLTRPDIRHAASLLIRQ